MYACTVIRLTSVAKSFETGHRVLDSVNLDIKNGEFLYVVGGSGAGKTTLLRMLATEETPTAGHVSLFGYNLTQVRGSRLQSIRRAIGYVPQNVRLIPDLSVYDNLAISVTLAGRSKAQNHVMKLSEVAEKLGLSHRLKTLAGALSGGEAQRVAVARALVREPDLIIADEPTGAQDNEHTWAMMELFAKMNQAGTTVILATHDREIIRRVRKRCVWLRSGHITIEGQAQACT